MREDLLSESAKNVLNLHRSQEFRELDISGQLNLGTLDDRLKALAEYFESLDEIDQKYKNMCNDFFHEVFSTCERDTAIVYLYLAVAHYGMFVHASSSIDHLVERYKPRFDRLVGGG